MAIAKRSQFNFRLDELEMKAIKAQAKKHGYKPCQYVRMQALNQGRIHTMMLQGKTYVQALHVLAAE